MIEGGILRYSYCRYYLTSLYTTFRLVKLDARAGVRAGEPEESMRGREAVWRLGHLAGIACPSIPQTTVRACSAAVVASCRHNPHTSRLSRGHTTAL